MVQQSSLPNAQHQQLPQVIQQNSIAKQISLTHTQHHEQTPEIEPISNLFPQQHQVYEILRQEEEEESPLSQEQYIGQQQIKNEVHLSIPPSNSDQQLLSMTPLNIQDEKPLGSNGFSMFTIRTLKGGTATSSVLY